MSFKDLTRQWLLDLLAERIFGPNLIESASRDVHVESDVEVDCFRESSPHDMTLAVRLLLLLLWRARHHRAALMELTALPDCLGPKPAGRLFAKRSGIDCSSPGVAERVAVSASSTADHYGAGGRTASGRRAACQADR